MEVSNAQTPIVV